MSITPDEEMRGNEEMRGPRGKPGEAGTEPRGRRNVTRQAGICHPGGNEAEETDIDGAPR